MKPIVVVVGLVSRLVLVDSAMLYLYDQMQRILML